MTNRLWKRIAILCSGAILLSLIAVAAFLVRPPAPIPKQPAPAAAQPPAVEGETAARMQRLLEAATRDLSSRVGGWARPTLLGCPRRPWWAMPTLRNPVAPAVHGGPCPPYEKNIRELDLAGIIRRETNTIGKMVEVSADFIFCLHARPYHSYQPQRRERMLNAESIEKVLQNLK